MIEPTTLIMYIHFMSLWPSKYHPIYNYAKLCLANNITIEYVI